MELQVVDGLDFYDAVDIKRELTYEAWVRFQNWMFGQTVMALPNGHSGIYRDDFERWQDGLGPLD